MSTKRLVGPEASILPTHIAQKRTRNPLECRPIFAKRHLSQANGSSFIETGNTKVICSVFGPRQAQAKSSIATSGILKCEFKFAPFSGGKRRGYARDDLEKEYSLALEEALKSAVRLELIPKSCIDVYVLVLENDGSASALAAGITAASLALVDAGIEMFDVVTACACGVVGTTEPTLLMDPTLDEEKELTGSMVLACMPSLQEVTFLSQRGCTTSENVLQSIQDLVGVCTQIHETIKDACLAPVF